eukprot:GILI01023710.1.p1 GENE.GILI01023710.1~~GILI01023710.1.p1  ORF type:complete len:262 (+),score=54.98 GILI01023710.1:77-862(+)
MSDVEAASEVKPQPIDVTVIADEPTMQINNEVKPGIFERLHFNDYMSAVIVEFIGSFLFILTIPLSSINDAEVAPLAIGFMLMAMVFSFGYISGGHFNPAVSLAVAISTDFPIHKFILYVMAQCGGGVVAAFYCVMIHGTDFPVPDLGLDIVNMIRAFLAESVYTFVLASAVLHVACSKQKNNNFYGFAIGMAVLSAAFCVGGVSGGAFNPAVATGLIVVRCLMTYCEPLANLWIFWAAEGLGAIVASLFYMALSDIVDDL